MPLLFVGKNVRSFCIAGAALIFSAKVSEYFVISLKVVKSLPFVELVKLKML